MCPLPRRVCPLLFQFDDRRSDIVKQIVHVRLECMLHMCVEPLCLGMLCACGDDASACCFLFSCIPSWGDTEGAISAMCVCVRVHTRTPSFAVALHRILPLFIIPHYFAFVLVSCQEPWHAVRASPSGGWSLRLVWTFQHSPLHCTYAKILKI